MCGKNIFIFLTLLTVAVAKIKVSNTPPHCTVVSKQTDYFARYRMDYPAAHLIPGQREAFQQMYCVNPPKVNMEWAKVCDWAAPPQVQFTLTDDYLHVVRQDPARRFAGHAVIYTYQICSHNISHVESHHTTPPTLVLVDNEVV